MEGKKRFPKLADMVRQQRDLEGYLSTAPRAEVATPEMVEAMEQARHARRAEQHKGMPDGWRLTEEPMALEAAMTRWGSWRACIWRTPGRFTLTSAGRLKS